MPVTNAGPNDNEMEYVEDTDLPLTEEDLEENNLDVEEADHLEWDEENGE